MARDVATRGQGDTLYRAIIGTALVLAMALAVIMLFPATRVTLAAIPSFVVMTHGFIILAASCIAFLALGRHRVLRDPASYWTGIAFAVLAVVSTIYVLAWPGLRPQGQPLIGHLPGTSAWITELMQLCFGLLIIAAATLGWPGPQALTGRRWGWSVAGWLSLAAVLGALVVAFEEYLPQMIGPGGVFTPLSVGVEYLDLLAMAAAAALSARHYRRSGDTLYAYTALALTTWTFGWAASLAGGERYAAPWYLGRFFLIGGCLVVLFGLLWEYVALYRREQEATQAAERRASELEAVVDSIADGVMIYDENANLLRTNATMRAQLQYTDAESKAPLATRLNKLGLSGATGHLIPDDDLPVVRALRGETVVGFEMTMYPGTEREATSLYSGAPLHGPGGNITGAVITATDVTDLLQARQQLRDNEQRYRSLFESMIEGYAEHQIIRDEQGRPIDYLFLSANPAFYALTGYENVIGKRVTEVIPGVYEAAPEMFERYGRVAETGQPDAWEFYVEPTERWWAVSVYSSEPEHFVTVFADITARKQAQDELFAQRVFLQQVMDQMPSGVLVIEADSTRVLLANQAIARIWGRDMAGVAMRDFLDPVRATDSRGELRGAADWPALRALAGEVLQNEVVRVSRPDGNIMHISANAAPVLDEQGNIIAAILAATDVTAAAQTQEELQRHRDHLDDLVKQRTAELDANQEELLRLNRVYSVLSQANEAIIRRRTRVEMFRDICRVAVEEGNFRMAWAGMVDPEISRVVPVAFWGHEDGYLSAINVTAQDNANGRGPTGRAVRSGGHQVCNDIANDPRMAPWADEAARRGYRSSGAFPFRAGDLVGALTFYSDELDFFDEQGIHLLQALALDVSIALQREQTELALQAHQDALRTAAAELAQAEHRERQRIATVLHDEVAQPLGAIKLYLSILRSQHPQGADDVGRLLELTDEAITHSRGIMTDLSPPVLQRMGLGEALRWWATVVEERHGLKVHVDAPASRLQIDSTLEVAVFQAAKELIQNAVKHAQAREIRLELACAEGDLRVVVADDGRGFDPSQAVEATAEGGFGLFNLRDRIEYFGGSTTVSSEPGAGAEITLMLPRACPGGPAQE